MSRSLESAPDADAAEISRLAAYVELTKPGIAGYVMITAGTSFYVASRGAPAFLPLIHTLVGTVAATAGSLALNQFIERRVDALMNRTRGRPLPSGRVDPTRALAFGGALLAAGLAWLYLAVGPLPAGVAAVSAGIYNLGYTPLKSRSYLATLVGAVPGALPVVIGWTAATGALRPGALALFAVLFLWQLPHVLAIGWLLRHDYARAGLLLVPPTDPTGTRIGWHMVVYSAALIPVSLSPVFLGLAGAIYFGGALLLGALYLAASAAAAREMTATSARRVFFGSLAYLPLLLVLLLVDTIRI